MKRVRAGFVGEGPSNFKPSSDQLSKVQVLFAAAEAFRRYAWNHAVKVDMAIDIVEANGYEAKAGANALLAELCEAAARR